MTEKKPILKLKNRESLLALLKNNQRGFAMVWGAVFLTVLLGGVALVVDLSHAYAVSNELKTISDSAALMAAKTYTEGLSQAIRDGQSFDAMIGNVTQVVRQKMDLVIAQNRILNNASQPVEYDLFYGRYTPNDQPYREGTSTAGAQFRYWNLGEPAKGINAFYVRAFRGRNNNPMRHFFAQIMGSPTFLPWRESISMIPPRDIILAVDTSTSMDWQTYCNSGYGQDCDFFIQPLANGAVWVDPRSPHSRPPGPGKVFPQPSETVFQSCKIFTQLLLDQLNLGDQVGVTYFADGSKIKMPLTELTQQIQDQQLVPLFENSLFYNNLIWQGDHYILPAAVAHFDPDTNQFDSPIGVPYGLTNNGGSFDQAVTMLNAAAARNPYAIPIIVMFTDGYPTCRDLGNGTIECSPNPAVGLLKLAREYTFHRATAAIRAGVFIYPITFTRLNQFGQRIPTKILWDEIAYLSGLENGHFNIGNARDPDELKEQLDKVFVEIAANISFVLVG
jgi:hypothetical protein